MLNGIPKLLAICMGLFVVTSTGFTADIDWHLSHDGNRVFFLRSAFAHGYMHGYEAGFHAGDMDLQMGRRFQPVNKQDDFKKLRGYRLEFGDHGSFQEGYRKGYAVGYTDCSSGRSFRATELLQLVRSEALPDSAAIPDRGFDRAFTTGYNLGQKAGLSDGRATAPLANMAVIKCDGLPNKDDCSAYRYGYRLGYSDGYTNQRDSGTVLALK